MHREAYTFGRQCFDNLDANIHSAGTKCMTHERGVGSGVQLNQPG